MTERPDDGVRALHPHIRWAWMFSGLLTTLALSTGAGLVEFFWLSRQDWYPLPGFLATGIVVAVLLVVALAMPRLWYRAWRYQVREHDVLMRHGVLWTVTQSVPRLRIQHVDVHRDPIDRLLGLASVTIYTAGSGGEDATIPGLTPDDAEALREALLIRTDAESPEDPADDPATGHADDPADGPADAPVPREAAQAPPPEPGGEPPPVDHG